MTRWVVRKSVLGLGWMVWWSGDAPLRLVPPYFQSWRAAMRFVDEQVRTVRVTLPAPVPDPPVDVHRPAWHVSESMTRPWVAPIGRFVHVSDRTGWGDQIDADVAERYGLAMLAAAKHAKGDLP